MRMSFSSWARTSFSSIFVGVMSLGWSLIVTVSSVDSCENTDWKYVFRASAFSCGEMISCESMHRVPMPIASDLLCPTYFQNSLLVLPALCRREGSLHSCCAPVSALFDILFWVAWIVLQYSPFSFFCIFGKAYLFSQPSWPEWSWSRAWIVEVCSSLLVYVSLQLCGDCLWMFSMADLRPY